jgi:hypothetical protein
MKLELKHLAHKQNSFLYIQERLQKINPYITYRPRVKTPIGLGTIIIDQNCYRIEYDNGKFENLVKSLRFWQDDFRLIVHNLSYLTKEIEVNGEKFIPSVKLKDDLMREWSDTLDSEYDEMMFWNYSEWETERVLQLPYVFVQKFFEWNLDVYGLIKAGLAIDINTLNSPI